MGIETIALIAGTAIAAGAAGEQAHEAHATEVHAGQQRRDAEFQRGTLLAQAQEQEKQQAASQQAEQARIKQRQMIAAGYGRASTILTGPEGLGGNAAPLGSAS